MKLGKFAQVITLSVVMASMSCADSDSAQPAANRHDLLWQELSTGTTRLILGNGTEVRVELTGCGRLYYLNWDPSGEFIQASCDEGTFGRLVTFDSNGQLVDETPDRASESTWSPTGTAFAYYKRTPERSVGADLAVRYLDGRPSQVIEEAWEGAYATDRPGPQFYPDGDPVLRAGFSPDGASFSFYRARYASCSSECARGLIIHDLTTGDERALGDLVPLKWVLGGGALIAAAGYRWDGYQVTYTTLLVDVATGDATPIPALDDFAHIWLSPDAKWAAFARMRGDTLRADLGVLDLTTLETFIVDGATLADTDGGQVRVTNEGHVYWLQDSRAGMDVLRVSASGVKPEHLGTLVRAYDGAIAPDLQFVAFVTASGGSGPALHMSRIDGSDVTMIGSSADYYWRP